MLNYNEFKEAVTSKIKDYLPADFGTQQYLSTLLYYTQ